MQPAEMHSHSRLRPSVWARRVAVGRLVLTLSVQQKQRRSEPEPIQNRLTALRQEHGLSIEDLAEQFQIHPTTLRAIEKGEYVPGLRLALRVSTFFGLPIEAIFFTPASQKEQAEADLLAGSVSPLYERISEYPRHAEVVTAREERNATGV